MSKGIIYTLVLLLALVSASASYLPVSDIIFEYKGASCNENGTITLNLTHEGYSLRYSEIKLTAHADNLPPTAMIGQWYIGGYLSENYEAPVDNFTGSNFDGKQKYTFKTTHNIYTKDKYTITLSWPSKSIYQNNIKFAVECPGIKCNSDLNCISEQSCVNNACQWVSCGQEQYVSGHKCLQRCDDRDKCTRDNFIDNNCIYTKIEKCCEDNKECNWDNECKDNECVNKPIEEFNFFQKIWLWLKSRYE